MKFDVLAINCKRLCHLTVATVLFGVFSFGQNLNGDGFQQLTIDDGKISFAMPTESVVHNNTGRSQVIVHGLVDGVSVSANVRKTGNGLRWMKEGLERDDKEDADSEESKSLVKSEPVKVGDYHLRTITRTSKEEFYLFLESTSGSKYLTITIRAKDATNPMIQRVLASISFEGKAVFNKITAAAPTVSATVSVFHLKSSEVVKEALKRKQIGKINVRVDEKTLEPKSGMNFYSRPLIILSKPFARYTDTAMSRGVSGIVQLRIQFKADGDIGDITVKKDLGSGLTDNAVEAAKRIKFLPAQVDGKNVDITKTFQYTFATY